MAATDQERSSLRAQIALWRRRLALLEQQAAALGWRVDPAINMEITDLRFKIAEAEETLKPPKQLSKETWGSMSPDERIEYCTTLVLQLNADFEAYYLKTRHLIRVGIVWLIAIEVVSVLARWFVH